MRRLAFVAVVMTVALSACAGNAGVQGTPEAGSSTNSSSQESNVTTPAASGLPPQPSGSMTTPAANEIKSVPPSIPGMSTPSPIKTGDPRVQAAVKDLANRKKVSYDTVGILSYETGSWPNGSLGCPQKGKMYTQAVVPGERLILLIEEEKFYYHAAKGQSFSLCTSPSTFLTDSGR